MQRNAKTKNYYKTVQFLIKKIKEFKFSTSENKWNFN